MECFLFVIVEKPLHNVSQFQCGLQVFRLQRCQIQIVQAVDEAGIIIEKTVEPIPPVFPAMPQRAILPT